MHTHHNTVHEFAVIGGPLHRLGQRLGLVTGKTNSLRLGLALGLFSWGVLFLLAVLQGLTDQLFSLRVIGVHVRLLAVIPLLFYCEKIVSFWMDGFARNIVDSRVIPEKDLPAYDALIRRIDRLNDTSVIEFGFIAVVFLMPFLEPIIGMPGGTSTFSITGPVAGGVVWAKVWYFGVCLTFFRFLMVRWLWHLLLWWYFLWRVSRFDLKLVPTHPDMAGGLGYLEVAQENFISLVIAVSLVFSASYAEGIISLKVPFETLYMLMPSILLLNAALFLGPLFIFLPKLWKCRAQGLNEYMSMAARYVGAFDKKWLRSGKDMLGDEQLGTADMQSLADLGASVSVVGAMRIVPISKRLVMELAVASIVPFLPLFLIKYRFDQIILQLLKLLAG